MQNMTAHNRLRAAINRHALRRRLFGNAALKRVVFRMGVDIIVANAVLVAAAVLRVTFSGQLNFDDPVGQLVGKFNRVYLLHAGWFAMWAVFLLTLSGLYRPLLSSQIRSRFIGVTTACGIGLILHLFLGGIVQNRLAATAEIAVPAWTLLGMTVKHLLNSSAPIQ